MAGLGKIVRNNILAINSGSSSLKFRLYIQEKQRIYCSIEEIGGKAVIFLSINGEDKNYSKKIANHIEACKEALIILGEYAEEISFVSCRIVHGRGFSGPVIASGEVIRKLEKNIELAPLHMFSSLDVLRFFMGNIKAKFLLCFDNTLFNELPKVSKYYAIPERFTKKGIFRYGFHGLAHEQMYEKAGSLLNKKFEKVITLQLGNGASACAFLKGKSIDTSMGFTPLEGLVMGTRAGDLDLGIIDYLSRKNKLSVKSILSILNHKSGLKGIAGESDVRKLLQREKKGDRKAALALDIFAYRVKKYLGAYFFALNGCELIVLGGGIARAGKMRKRILENLESFGIAVDEQYLYLPTPILISKGKVKILALETDEQEALFEKAKEYLER